MIDIVKDSWSKITVDDYYRIMEIIKEDKDDMMKDAELLAVLCDVFPKDILALKLPDIIRLKQKTGFISEGLPRHKKIKADNIKIGDNTYKLIHKIDKYTAAQFIDFQTIIKQDKNDIARILSTILIPKGKEYGEDYDVEDVVKDIRFNMGMDVANSLVFFCIKKWMKYVGDSVIFQGLIIQTQVKTKEKTPLKMRMNSLKMKLKMIRDMVGLV